MGKIDIIISFKEEIRNKYSLLNNRLLSLYDDCRITKEDLSFYSPFTNIYYEQILGCDVNKLTIRDINDKISHFKESMDDALKFIDKNESCKFEDSHMQLLIKYGYIKKRR